MPVIGHGDGIKDHGTDESSWRKNSRKGCRANYQACGDSSNVQHQQQMRSESGVKSTTSQEPREAF